MNIDKNTVIGFILMAIVFFGFMFYEGKVQKERAEQMQKEQVVQAVAQQKSDSIKVVEEEKQALKEMEQKSDSSNILFAARQLNEGTTVIENELLKLTIQNKGGQLARAELKDPTYKNQQGGPVVLFDQGDSEMQFNFDGKDDNMRPRTP